MKKITIITSLQKKRSNLKYFFECVSSITKICLYSLYNKQKYLKYKEKLNILLTYGNIELGGHSAMLLSLIRGFQTANIKYVLNPNVDDITENVLICWVNYDEFQTIISLKSQGIIKRLICTPISASYDYEKMMPLMANSKEVNSFLVASKPIISVVEKQFTIKDLSVFKVWISGVQKYELNRKKQLKHKVLYYNKIRPLDEKIIELFKKLDIEYIIIKYGSYVFSSYVKELNSVDIAIFDTAFETQGLALAEAWMQNVPTLVRKVTDGDGQSSAPYLTDDTGLFFDNITELESILLNYKNDPTLFLSKFKPHEWVSNNMTDEISAKALIKFFEG